MKAVLLCTLLLLAFRSEGVDRSGSLYYFNSPESVTRPGIVGEATLPAGRQARIFFHFVNKTRRPQDFEVALDNPMINCISGVGVSQDPGSAGASAVKIYLDKRRRNVKGPFDMFKTTVQPGSTVSGVVEGTPKEIAHVVCSMGKGSALPWNVAYSSLLIVRGVNVGKSLVLGDDQAPVKGAYGTEHHLRFVNPERKAKQVAVYFSPRGGAARFVYLYKDAIHTTALIPARHTILLFRDTVPALGTLSLTSFPLGGYSYPCRISVKVAG